MDKSDDIKHLRETTGAGLHECAKALEHCHGDILLAAGYLKYYGCAINTYDTPHEEWVMRRAHAWKRQQLAEKSDSDL